MNLKTGLKWIFFLFCMITTFQLITTVAMGVLILGVPLGRAVYCPRCLLELMVIALAGALPTLVLVQAKVLSWIPMAVRRSAHFLLTFGTVCGLLIYWDWYTLSAWLLLPFSLFLTIYVFTSFFWKKHILAKRTAQRYAEEQKRLQYYTDELERYQVGVRKFKHDYQNILLSLDAYVENGDLVELRQYYCTSIKPASHVITKNSFALDGLDKIKIRAIKSFLTAKLLLMQNTDMDIRTCFEANENIDYIPLDLVALVRMLGILLDNAIEELTELSHGELFVSCLKWDAGITFVVQNTCRPDLPSSQQLWQTGFSTKGNDRGLGLSNLSELVDTYANVTLSTKISKNSFRQELLIEDEAGRRAPA